MSDRSGQKLAIVIVGSVDHGKSTLIGRLMHDTGALAEGKFEALKAMSTKRGMPFEWAFALDAMQAERDQGITIDTARIRFATKKREYIIIDAPGHREFLKNMVTGASAADAALLLVDADEGVREQSRRHAYLLHLLGIRQVAVLVNKMDLVDYDADRFGTVAEVIRANLMALGIEPARIIPIAARDGENLLARSSRMLWYQGPAVVDMLDEFVPRARPTEAPLRLPVQDVYKFDQRRIIAGRVESGQIKVGDQIMFSPSNKTVKVASIEAWNVPELPTEASAGSAVGITLDEQIFVERGEVISHPDRAPILTNVFRGKLFWLSRKPLEVGRVYTLKLATTEAQVTVEKIDKVIDTQDLAERQVEKVERDEAAEVIFRSSRTLALDEYETVAGTGRFVLVDDYVTVAAGLVSMEGYPDQRRQLTVRATDVYAVGHAVHREARALRNGHEGGVLWLTGLSGAGKSTLALALERELFAKGWQVYVLDGDNVRSGLNKDLGFGPEDRAENIRRIGEVAALFADAGFLVVTSFISPYRTDRQRAREAAGDRFREIYVKASLESCEARDPKGLYRKARAGKIKDFTGVQAPYEEPEHPDVVVETDRQSEAECIGTLMTFVRSEFGI
ncbi:MAG TPA: adenylyl-sulfate kinase [Geminicoccus sp.]|jgi:bifunctional enzyme CysN/CysC|uniref:adenylyl-sulfate kinase n=1 Tax=Geminicoccus sp. TaxID=2024832 RepID=UPI002E33728D|nr:adenylyl-sulfate kinase [Geminicoccus sp.]HEX2527947.1 adenylyl-sulfate kinase [Geminicoccus sp.]